MNSTVKTVVFWLVILLSAIVLWQVVKMGGGGQKEKEINFSMGSTATTIPFSTLPFRKIIPT